MNPVLLKPTGERTSQVVVMGRPVGCEDAQGFQTTKQSLQGVVLAALAALAATSTWSSWKGLAARPRPISWTTTW